MSVSEALGEQREVQLDLGAVRYRELGTGPPIVFVHGLLVNGDLWRGVVPELATAGFRCITPDWPLGSHSLPMNRDARISPHSIAGLIAGFLDKLDLDGVTLAGNDTGGALCQLVVTTRPQAVARLVLTNCDAFDNFPPKMFLPIKWAAYLPGALYLLAQSMRLRPMRRLPISFGWLTRRPIPNDILDSYLNPSARIPGVRRDATKLLRAISPRQTLEAAEKLSGFDRPVLLAWAPQDRFFPFAHAERLAGIFPNARLERVDDCATFVPEDQPQHLAGLIAGFMNETGGR
ncbi:MAG: alpha/beta hydrolase [Dehalococcoidia bacterium]